MSDGSGGTARTARGGTTARPRPAPRAVVVALAVVLASALAACSGPAAAPPPPPVQLATSVVAGDQRVAPANPLVVSAAGGRLTAVTVTPAGAAPLAGTLDPSGTRWVSAPLTFGTRYRVQAAGVGTDGAPGAPLDQSFRTVNPAKTLDVETMRPSDGQTVGVAMPISITFGRDVVDRAAVERRMTVTTSVPTEGSFHWMSDSVLDWRPRNYWRPGTRVTVASRLRGIDAGDGVYGGADTVRSFTVGRAQRAFGDVNEHTLELFQDGKRIKSFPATFGKAIYPSQSGIHVAFEKHLQKRMTSASWGGPAIGAGGYDEVLPLAVRISNNGEFVHVNQASLSAQGNSNVSHGCVNLSMANGRFFFDWIQLGDPVEIVGSPKPLTPADGDIADWTIPWERYKQGSALVQP